MDHETYVERLATLAVEVGADVQHDQIVALSYAPGMEPLAHAIATKAYQRGARFVDPFVFDGAIKRARLEHARDDTLDFVPEWYGHRLLAIGEAHAARIAITPTPDPGMLAGVDPVRAGKDQLPALKELPVLIRARSTNWTIVPYPTPGWAAKVHPDLGEREALDRLRDQLAHILRLDEPDPADAWRRRGDELIAAATRLNERRFDALRFHGSGTDLTVGLFPSSSWVAARQETAWGQTYYANLPSEEIFTTPDPQRVEGTVTATKPLDVAGALVEGLRVRFEGGRAVEIDADSGAEVLRARAARDEGASRLGEVALVDRAGRIAGSGSVFWHTLLDENAASHIAIGQAYENCVLDDGEREHVNRSTIHIDFMIGGDEVDVSGLAADASETPVLRGGEWQI
jgi:aminopeptidase